MEGGGKKGGKAREGWREVEGRREGGMEGWTGKEGRGMEWKLAMLHSIVSTPHQG